MKTSRFVKVASIGVLSLGLTAIPFSISALAQDATSPDGTPAVEEPEFDWGWLGLLGLAGLAGLAGKKRDDRPEHQADTPITPRANVPTPQQTDAPRYRDPYQDPNIGNRPD